MKKTTAIRKETKRTFVFTQDEIKEILLDHLAKTEQLYEDESTTLYLDDTDCLVTLELELITEEKNNFA